MGTASKARIEDPAERMQDLFQQIGEFLAAHRLSPDPAHYAFAYRMLAEPDGKLAGAVSAIVDGGVRLTHTDIQRLGHAVDTRPLDAQPVANERQGRIDAIVEQTQAQVRGFEDIVTAIHAETQDFGRDLQAGAAAMREFKNSLEVDGLVRITGSMLERIRSAENRLEAATHEARDLREKLNEARDDARRDPLTGLPNRRAFGEEFFAKRRQALSMCVALCDIDRFKAVNDRFGHAVGDRVLKAIASALSTSCEGHLIARHGGEEFAVLFSGVELNGALALLEDAREVVQAKRFRLRETDAPLGEITFSAGLVAVGPGEPLEDVLVRADGLLYSAKDGGRNRVVTG